MEKYATFFGGAINDTTTNEYYDSVLIGELLAENGYILKNGGYRGLMEAVTLGSNNKNGKSIGFTCKSFGNIRGNKYLTEVVVCENIYERLNKLIEDSEIFIVQKGGYGTLSELFLTIDIIRKLPITKRPKIILFGKFWQPYVELLISTYGNDNLFDNVDCYQEFKNIYF